MKAPSGPVRALRDATEQDWNPIHSVCPNWVYKDELRRQRMADDAPIPADRSDISELLTGWGNREPHARDRVVAALYEELRRLARIHLDRERPDHTLQPTALVNE